MYTHTHVYTAVGYTPCVQLYTVYTVYTVQCTVYTPPAPMVCNTLVNTLEYTSMQLCTLYTQELDRIGVTDPTARSFFGLINAERVD